jgi:3-oxoacyl-[acyl-carrier protein] reductase
MIQGLHGKRALVTGASGTIGAAIAKALAAEGVRTVLHYHTNKDAARGLLDEIIDCGGTATMLGADLTDESAASELIKKSVSQWDGLEILVNNAGITRDGLLPRMSEEDWDVVMDTNLKSIFMCTRAALRPMMRARFGRIINIASVSGLMGNPGQTNYSAAKAGLIGFTKALAREVASRGITVNSIAPGFVESPMVAALSGETIEKVTEAIPVGRLGRSDEIGSWVAFLASDAGDYVTGQTVVVDGGLTM